MNNDENYAISIDSATKIFDKLQAVYQVSINIPPGEIYALSGPNGAGKTTLIKMLIGLLRPTSGNLRIFSHSILTEPINVKTITGYVPDNPEGYEYLTGKEFIELTGKLRGLENDELAYRMSDLSKIFPIGKIINEQIGNYSRGNRQKVAILAALINKPKVLLIDEPIVGLDPDSIEILGVLLRNFAKDGGAVLFVSHILPFTIKYADKVGIMSQGKLVKEGKAKDVEKLMRNVK